MNEEEIRNKSNLGEGTIFGKTKDDLYLWIHYTKHNDELTCTYCNVSEKIRSYKSAKTDDDSYRWQMRGFVIQHKRCERKAKEAAFTNG